jgi:hypothetical protein
MDLPSAILKDRLPRVVMRTRSGSTMICLAIALYPESMLSNNSRSGVPLIAQRSNVAVYFLDRGKKTLEPTTFRRSTVGRSSAVGAASALAIGSATPDALILFLASGAHNRSDRTSRLGPPRFIVRCPRLNPVSRPVVDPQDRHRHRGLSDPEDDPVRMIDKLPEIGGELDRLWDQGTSER